MSVNHLAAKQAALTCCPSDNLNAQFRSRQVRTGEFHASRIVGPTPTTDKAKLNGRDECHLMAPHGTARTASRYTHMRCYRR